MNARVKSGESPLTSDLSSALEVCIDDDARYKSTYTLLYFTLQGDPQTTAMLRSLTIAKRMQDVATIKHHIYVSITCCAVYTHTCLVIKFDVVRPSFLNSSDRSTENGKSVSLTFLPFLVHLHPVFLRFPEGACPWISSVACF